MNPQKWLLVQAFVLLCIARIAQACERHLFQRPENIWRQYSHFTPREQVARRTYSSGYASGSTSGYTSSSSTSNSTSNPTASPTTPAPTTPAPTAPTPGPTADQTKPSIIRQEVAFNHLSATQWTGDLKTVYEAGYGMAMGIFSNTTNAYLQGCSVNSVLSRRAITVMFTATVVSAYATAAIGASQSISSTSLVANIQAASTAMGRSVILPATADITVSAPVMTTQTPSSNDGGGNTQFIEGLGLVVACIAGLSVPICALRACRYSYRMAEAPPRKWDNAPMGLSEAETDMIAVLNEEQHKTEAQNENMDDDDEMEDLGTIDMSSV